MGQKAEERIEDVKKGAKLLTMVAVVCAFTAGWLIHAPPTVKCPACSLQVADTAEAFVKFSGSVKANLTTSGYCDVNGTPIIRMYSAPWCPHCVWAAPAFDSLAAEHPEFIFRHWNVDNSDDLLTNVTESGMPVGDFVIKDSFSDGSVPFYVFGCDYYRVGNLYESIDDLELEKQSFEDAMSKVV